MRALALAVIAACVLVMPAEAKRHDGAAGLVTSYCSDRVCGTVDPWRRYTPETRAGKPKRAKPSLRPGAMSKNQPYKLAEKLDTVPLPRPRPLHPFAWLAVEPDSVVFVPVAVGQFNLEVRQRLLDAATAALGKGPAALGTRANLWCADFINRTLRRIGLNGTNSSLASSFARYGQAAKPAPGVIAVKPRAGGNHVVIIKEVRGRELVAVSGNSGGKVRLMRYRIAQFYAFRAPDVVMR